MQQTADHPSHGLAVLHRSFDIDRINNLANHPEVRPFVGGDITQPLDLSVVVQDERNVWLLGEWGGFLYQWTSPGAYEVHTMIVKSGRGSWAAHAAKMSLDIMSGTFGAKQIWTRIKPDQQHIISYASGAGLKACGNGFFDIGSGPEIYNLYEKRF